MSFRTIFVSAMMMAVAIPAAASAWPGSAGTSVGEGILSQVPSFEPSGIVWLEGRGTFVVVSDEGQVAELKPDGTVLALWALGSQYDLEDVAVIDPSSALVYLGDENNSSAREFDLSTGLLTGKSWSFASKLSEVNGTSGMEGLAFVPDGSHPFGVTGSGGVFYAGWQYDGDIYVFAPDLATGGSQTFLEEIHMTSGYTDLAALSYNDRTKRVYALYDGLNILEERDANGSLVATYSVPGSDQEGIAVADEYPAETARVLIAEDSGRVYAYDGYPVTYPAAPVEVYGDARDNDGDGVVDENNTLAENGPHPTYSSLVPVSGSGFGTDILSVAGLRDGDILVEFGDHARYAYDVYDLTTRATPLVTSLDQSAYLVVRLGKRTSVVNGYTGEVLATTRGFKWAWVADAWARTVVGW